MESPSDIFIIESERQFVEQTFGFCGADTRVKALNIGGKNIGKYVGINIPFCGSQGQILVPESAQVQYSRNFYP